MNHDLIDLYAGQAMDALIQKGYQITGEDACNLIAKRAYEIAEAMMRAREKRIKQAKVYYAPVEATY